MGDYRSPYSITLRCLDLIMKIGAALEAAGKMATLRSSALRRSERVRTIQATLAIEGNTLDLDQVTAILEGKRVAGPFREVREVKNAIEAYERLDSWNPCDEADFLAAHSVLTQGLVETSGAYRRGGVGIQRGHELVHIAPPAELAPFQARDLLAWLARSEEHPLIAPCVFHYEIEFIHPFTDGNGRMGRLWHSLILRRWNQAFAALPLECVIRDRQQEYYAALRVANATGTATSFVEFLLGAILDAALSLSSSDQVCDPLSAPVALPLKSLADGAASSLTAEGKRRLPEKRW